VEVAVGEGDVELDGEGLGDAVAEVVGMSDDAGGDEVGEVVADGVLEGERDGVAGVDVPWAGPTRFGVCTACPVKSRARAAIAMPSTATAPPVAIPAANARRSRRYSVRRRSRSQAGSAARRAAQLLTGAAAMPRVGNSSRPASSGPLSWSYLVRAAAMPAKPNSASRPAPGHRQPHQADEHHARDS
jgi:hypothetical protein